MTTNETFVPEYDIDVVLYAQSLGWDHNSMLGDDCLTHEEVVANYQKKLGIGFDEAVQMYRTEIAIDIEEYLTKVLGSRV